MSPPTDDWEALEGGEEGSGLQKGGAWAGPWDEPGYLCVHVARAGVC